MDLPTQVKIDKAGYYAKRIMDLAQERSRGDHSTIQKTLGFSEISILADSGPVLQFPASVELIAEINVRTTGEPTV